MQEIARSRYIFRKKDKRLQTRRHLSLGIAHKLSCCTTTVGITRFNVRILPGMQHSPYGVRPHFGFVVRKAAFAPSKAALRNNSCIPCNNPPVPLVPGIQCCIPYNISCLLPCLSSIRVCLKMQIPRIPRTMPEKHPPRPSRRRRSGAGRTRRSYTPA